MGASNEVVVAVSRPRMANGDFVVAKVNSTGSELWRANEGNATGLATLSYGPRTVALWALTAQVRLLVTGRIGSGPGPRAFCRHRIRRHIANGSARSMAAKRI